jgi:hypothetical protein
MRDGHSSWAPVTRRLQQPTRTAGLDTDLEVSCACAPKPRAAPIRSCSRWGLPCRRRCRRRGALLPHRFTLAAVDTQRAAAVCSLWHYPWARTRRTLSGTACPRSPDFTSPAVRAGAAVRPTDPEGMEARTVPVKRRRAAPKRVPAPRCFSAGPDEQGDSQVSCAWRRRRRHQRAGAESGAETLSPPRM